MDHPECAGMVAEVQPGSLVVVIIQEDGVVTKEPLEKDIEWPSDLTSTSSSPPNFLIPTWQKAPSWFQGHDGDEHPDCAQALNLVGELGKESNNGDGHIKNCVQRTEVRQMKKRLYLFKEVG